VAASPEHGVSAAALVANADAALYRAKRDGRDRVCVASGSPERLTA
jgi:PleD family two-component response regulator